MDKQKLIERWQRQLIAVNQEMDRQRAFIGERLGVMAALRRLEKKHNKLVAKLNEADASGDTNGQGQADVQHAEVDQRSGQRP